MMRSNMTLKKKMPKKVFFLYFHDCFAFRVRHHHKRRMRPGKGTVGRARPSLFSTFLLDFNGLCYFRAAKRKASGSKAKLNTRISIKISSQLPGGAAAGATAAPAHARGAKTRSKTFSACITSYPAVSLCPVPNAQTPTPQAFVIHQTRAP